MSLSFKERRFVAEYIKDQNGTKAAIRAGYSERTAQEQSSRLLSKVMVRGAVDDAMRKIEQGSQVTREKILKMLMDIAEFDVKEIFNDDGTIKPLSEISERSRKVISSIEVDDANANIKKIRLSDKVRAIELLGKHLRLFADLKEHTGPNGGPIAISGTMPIDFKEIDTATLKKTIQRLEMLNAQAA